MFPTQLQPGTSPNRLQRAITAAAITALTLTLTTSGAAAQPAASTVATSNPPGASASLPTVIARSSASGELVAYDGVVEAVRQTVLAAQVPGAIVQLDVKAGDRVKAGQVLARIDARAADQAAVASEAQVQAARASLDVAKADLARQQQLFQKNYISPAALERAEAQFKATAAQVNAQLAQAGAARTQTGFHVVRAPYAGVVSEVPVTLGDMAMPGRALLTLYDPSALRVTAAVPHSALAAASASSPLAARAELPGRPADAQWPATTRTHVLPTVDPGTHTAQVRLDLPTDLGGVAPGMFARVWIAGKNAAAAQRVTVPASAIVRRSELTSLYVLSGNNQPLLRQVRLGRSDGNNVEVLAGLNDGERVVTEPQLAARVR
ncbi:MAG: efflux RND transporter periplasmic adaptor subunit [Burkholderiales bacterium]|nr:efflux RND transporter periplasmic adaptor subunit [Burkholderiales bacterium]